MTITTKSFVQALGLLCVMTIAACDRGITVPKVSVPPPPQTFTVGGSVSGLAGSGLVLQDNGGNDLSIAASGTFTFSTALASGAAFNVTVKTQPLSPTQTCAVGNATGTVGSANITNVAVLLEGPRQLDFLGVSGTLRPLDLMHLSGHFGIPNFDDDHMVPAP